MKKYILSVLLGGAFMFTACSDFLDEEPKGDITSEGYYKTAQHAIPATNAIYDYLIIGYAPNGLWDKNYGGTFYNDYWVLQDMFADNSETNQTSIDYQSVENMQIDQYNQPVELLWRDFYQTIKCCNVVIDKVPSIDMDVTLRNQLVAEAKFFRAMMYFDLIRMFGDVPLREHNVESAAEDVTSRTSKETIYELIFSDLKTAETDLKYAERFGGGRPYPASASALLARVYVTYAAEHQSKEHYQLAVDKAKSVIKSFPMLKNYGDLFKVTNRFNTEIIWGVNFSAALSEGWKGGQFLVRLLPALDGVSNAQGWENATEDLWNSFDQQNDQRLDVTLKRSFTYSDGSVEDFDKPYVFKYWDSQAEPKGNNTEAIFPAIRTAEMYLIIAEALNEINQGANEEAVIAINAVRNRAGLTTAVPTDYKGFKNAVLNEYRHEFVMEGHRWFDLTRMCTPQEFVSIIKAAKPESTPKEYHVKFPIPQREIDLSQNTITQNEGYGQ